MWVAGWGPRGPPRPLTWHTGRWGSGVAWVKSPARPASKRGDNSSVTRNHLIICQGLRFAWLVGTRRRERGCSRCKDVQGKVTQAHLSMDAARVPSLPRCSEKTVHLLLWAWLYTSLPDKGGLATKGGLLRREDRKEGGQLWRENRYKGGPPWRGPTTKGGPLRKKDHYKGGPLWRGAGYSGVGGLWRGHGKRHRERQLLPLVTPQHCPCI